jgi:hypothetical protein
MAVNEKMDVFQKRVATQHPLESIFGGHHCGVVSNSQPQGAALGGRDGTSNPFDQLSFLPSSCPSVQL